MAMLITSVAEVREAASEKGWRLFCEEQGFDPENPGEPEEGVMIDKLDLLRYGMDEAYDDLVASVDDLIGPRL